MDRATNAGDGVSEPTPPYVNQWGEEILGEYTETAKSAADPMFDNVRHWQLVRVAENDYPRREYGQEFYIVSLNHSRAQSWKNPEFTIETAKALRDMLSAVIAEAEATS